MMVKSGRPASNPANACSTSSASPQTSPVRLRGDLQRQPFADERMIVNGDGVRFAFFDDWLHSFGHSSAKSVAGATLKLLGFPPVVSSHPHRNYVDFLRLNRHFSPRG